jgi:hypothetical protein
VVGEAGMETFNRVWTSPETLPTKDEITSPRSWLERVAGSGLERPGLDAPGANGSAASRQGTDGRQAG